MVLTDWNEELVAVDRGSSQTRAEKQVGSPSKGSTEPVSGTKDPTKSLKRDAQLEKKGAKALPIDAEVAKKAEVTKTGANLSRSSRGKARQRSDLAAQNSLLPQAKVQTKRWLPSSERRFLTLLYR